MIGMGQGTTPVKSVTEIEIPSKISTSELTINKVNEKGQPLKGAEFTLSNVNGEKTTVLKEILIDNDNAAVTIAGLVAGNTYQLEETQAPNGYTSMRETVRSTVNENGKIQFDTFDENMKDFISVENNNVTIKNMQNTSLTVKKEWANDDGVNRPTKVTVQLMKDGKAEGEKVVLSEENGWTATWNDLDYDDQWSVGEVDVPEGYKDTVIYQDGIWTITNTYVPETSEP